MIPLAGVTVTPCMVRHSDREWSNPPVTVTPDMTASTPTTSAQRQAALRQRAREIAFGIDDDAVRAAPDSVLIEGLAMAYRAKQAAPVAAIAAELLLRLGRDKPVTVTAPDPVTVKPKHRRFYPPEIQAIALRMEDAGARTADIRDAVEAAHGTAPKGGNLRTLMIGWRSRAEDRDSRP